ncbi:hypothetical protein [Actinomadura geliboluensis]|uniref:hypothetical protein n=1 Tax=Actinomadura geliboluensis TaxID=882440 RepID=UPI003719A5B3
MRQVFRSVARVGAVAALVAGGGALVAIPPAMADVGVDLGLVCSGKAETHEVALRITTSVPASGTVGQPVQLGTIKIDVGLPPELVKEASATSPSKASAPPVTGVAPSSTPSPALRGVAEVKVAVREPAGDRKGGWPAFALAATPPDDDGTVHLTGSGVASPVLPASPGALSWSAGEMELSLTPEETTGKDAAELALHCVAEKSTLLGSVKVKAGNALAAPGVPTASPRQAAPAQENLCQTIPGQGEDPRYAINPDPELYKIYSSPDTPSVPYDDTGAGVMYCLKATGFFNIKKAGNAVPVAIENNVRAPVRSLSGDFFFGPNYAEHRGYFVNRTYPTPATMLGFGFMPTRAVAKAVQVGAPGSGKDDPITGNLRVVQRLDDSMKLTDPTVDKQEVRASAYVRLEADQAEVNGVPLALGSKCTTGPTLFYASGFTGTKETGSADYTQGQKVIAENVKIPAFSGCGVNEDLSPILTASVSGTGNYANLEAGIWCNVENGGNCVDGAAALPQTFSVSPGGDFTAVAQDIILGGTRNSEFRCDSARMRFHLDRGHWQSRFRLGKGSMSLDGCEVKARNGTIYKVHGEVVDEGDVWINMSMTFSGEWQMLINGVTLKAVVEQPDGSTCTLRLAEAVQQSFFDSSIVDERPGRIIGTYKDGTYSAFPELKTSMKSTCNISGFTDYSRLLTSQENKFVFQPEQEITSP